MLSTIFAQAVNITPGNGLTSLNFEIGNVVNWAVNAILIIAGLVFFFMLIFGGLQWIMSGGDKAKTEAARNKITAALIGLIIVFSAWAIAALITSIFGVDILNFTVPSING